MKNLLLVLPLLALLACTSETTPPPEEEEKDLTSAEDTNVEPAPVPVDTSKVEPRVNNNPIYQPPEL